MEAGLAGRCAIVTGANKGMGYEACKKLAEKGIIVVLTARDERRGKKAIECLKVEINDPDDRVLFHQLDVVDPVSISTLVDFIKIKFGKLDILVNNAGVAGIELDDPVLYEELIQGDVDRIACDDEDIEIPEEIQLKALAKITETYEIAEQCLNINYYGTKRMFEAFTPLLQLSDAPIVVNLASGLGKLKLLNNEWAKNVFSNAESLTEDRVDDVINEFLEHLIKGPIQRKVWPYPFSSYKLSKASINAYTRIISKQYPEMIINSISPGYVKTDITLQTGPLTPKEGAETVVKLAVLPKEGPSGLFFSGHDVTSF